MVMRNGAGRRRQAGAAPAHVLRSWVEGALAEVARSSSGT